ncbi:MAG: hypothetical protein NC293_07715 [Roseburia sp.]|nr:hypothetical protein [Roseburia sp.]
MAKWTSRYSNKELNDDKYYCVGISLGKPRFKLGYRIEDQCYSLAPKGYMLKMDLEPFKSAYYKKLEDIGTERIISMVRKFEEAASQRGKELVLLCFEDVRIPSDWCHRTVFAEWWKEQTGECIKELNDPTPPKEKKMGKTPAAKETEPEPYRQMSLFDTAGFTI